MESGIGQPAEGQSYIVELEPVPVHVNNIGRTMGAFRKHNIYFQFGERRKQIVTLCVLPQDLDDALRIATMASIDYRRVFRLLLWLGLPLALFIALAMMASMTGV
jgi:hypothetical protein